MWNSTLLKNSTLAGILHRQSQMHGHGRQPQQQQQQKQLSG
jgi:hypothetical protein